jgi:hypothetical protein
MSIGMEANQARIQVHPARVASAAREEVKSGPSSKRREERHEAWVWAWATSKGSSIREGLSKGSQSGPSSEKERGSSMGVGMGRPTRQSQSSNGMGYSREEEVHPDNQVETQVNQ